MLSARVRTIIISNPRERKRERATAYIIINILVADPLHIFVCASISEHGVRVPRYNGRPRTGVELEERTEREALFAYGTTLYNVERLFRYLQGVHVENFPVRLFCNSMLLQSASFTSRREATKNLLLSVAFKFLNLI